MSPTRMDVRRVIVLLAGSRTGSSFLFRALKSQGAFLTPLGEETPFYRRAGLGLFQQKDYSDEITQVPSEACLDRIGNELIEDIGIYTDKNPQREILAEDFYRRLELQWPGAMSLQNKIETLPSLNFALSKLPNDFSDWKKLYIDWISQLKVQKFNVEPSLFTAKGENPLQIPRLEEPPFVCPEPRVPANKELFSKFPLLLKTSTNLYRIPFLRALFPQAEFKFILLQRNPAATISALMDGWLSSGFHSHDVFPHYELKIKGYSDVVARGDRFWKFDMPPNWQSKRESPLEEVCAFQWSCAHERIEFMAKQQECIRVRYEDLLTKTSYSQVMQSILAFAEAGSQEDIQWLGSESVVSVDAPFPGKWKKRMPQMVSLLRDYEKGILLDMASSLHYDNSALESWP